MKLKISKRKIKQNILAVYNQCTEADKYDWYTEAHMYALSLVNSEVCINRACGIIASLSPLKSWSDNKRISALMVADKNTSGIHTQLCTQKARRIHTEGISDEAILDILRGEKISSFYLNIRYPKQSTHVTIDRHAFSIACGRSLAQDETKVTQAQYRLLKACYLELAKELGISPLLLQSATWVRWKQLKQTQTN